MEVKVIGGCWGEEVGAGDDLVGYFLLSDGTKTKFRIYDDGFEFQWQQWGNWNHNEGVTIDLLIDYVEKLNAARD